MKAIGIVSENIGGPELLEVVEVAKPVPAAEEVLLRLKAAALTRDELTWPETWYIHGDSAQPRPRPIIPGHEVSGIVEAVGEGVTAFQVGDEVYGLPALIAMVSGLNMPLSLPMRLPYVPDQSVMKRVRLSPSRRSPPGRHSSRRGTCKRDSVSSSRVPLVVWGTMPSRLPISKVHT